MLTRGISVLALITGLIGPSAAAGQTPAAWFGTWTLNVAMSRYDPGPAPYVRGTLTIEPWQDRVRITYDLVHVRGGVTHMEWTGAFDGADYPLQGPDEVITYAYLRLDDRTFDVDVKVDGRIAATARVVLSADGRSLRTDTVVTDARRGNVTTTTVYEKR